VWGQLCPGTCLLIIPSGRWPDDVSITTSFTMAVSMKELTIARAHQGYRRGEFTARQVVEYYLHRIATLDTDEQGPKLNSILAVSTTALAEAEALDASLKNNFTLTGPLHGIPVLIKDQANTQGLATTYGSIVAKYHVPSEDATLVSKLKAAGAIVLGKTTMPGKRREFARANAQL
jgi:amidase